jgi:multidrug efflux pump
VQVSIGEFTRSLVEAVVIVLAVSFFSLGWRPGIVVALCIPIVFALTFATMLAWHTAPSRVAGALIIALGLLVDDAIIVVEQIDTHLHSGWEKLKAVTSAYLVTAQPMLIGTLVTMLGFLPIALARSAAGEYASSIFAVVAISLASWIVAVFVTPFIAEWMLPEPAKGAQPENPASRWFPTVLMTGASIALPRCRAVGADFTAKSSSSSTAVMFVVSLGLFAVGVPKQFFPTSDRPELIVDLRASQNASFAQTLAVTQRLESSSVMIRM